MRQSIDKRVIEVLEKESQNLSKEQKDIQKIITDIEKITGNQTDKYSIAPRDTIGKSIRYNIRRK